MPTASSPPSAYSRRFKLGAALVLTIAISSLIAAVVLLDEGSEGPVLGGDQAVVESLVPRRGAQVPRQSSVGIDLAAGWDGTLVIGGIEIPRDQLRLTPEIGLIEYTPGDGKAVEQLDAGRNCVAALIWRIRDGRGVNDRTIPWCFEVV